MALRSKSTAFSPIRIFSSSACSSMTRLNNSVFPEVLIILLEEDWAGRLWLDLLATALVESSFEITPGPDNFMIPRED